MPAGHRRVPRWPLGLFVVVGIVVCTVAVCDAPVAAEARPAGPPPVIALDPAAEAVAQLPRAHSLLVSWRGELMVERYFNGTRATRLANIKSASKSVISALVGVAVDRGLIAGVTQPISAFFPDLLGINADARKRAITIEDLLTMRSGLETTSNRNYGAWVQSQNWVRHVLNRPLLNPPGTTMEYSTGSTHLLSAILTKATGKSTWQFAQETIAKPLGFQLAQWPRDPQGVYFGGNDMLMTPQQMLAFGELYLRNGRRNGQQVVPESWVAASQFPRTQSRRESDRYYGYGWWIRELAGHPAFYAWGYGGQYIFVVPDLDLVVVTTSSSTAGEERRDHRRTIYEIVEHFIIEPVASAATQSSAAN
jgi:CubicO group peptidase (beta-lactamase class C family)